MGLEKIMQISVDKLWISGKVLFPDSTAHLLILLSYFGL